MKRKVSIRGNDKEEMREWIVLVGEISFGYSSQVKQTAPSQGSQNDTATNSTPVEG